MKISAGTITRTICLALAAKFTRYSNSKTGDVMVFWRNGEFVHTGIVTYVSGDYFETVE